MFLMVFGGTKKGIIRFVTTRSKERKTCRGLDLLLTLGDGEKEYLSVVNTATFVHILSTRALRRNFVTFGDKQTRQIFFALSALKLVTMMLKLLKIEHNFKKTPMLGVMGRVKCTISTHLVSLRTLETAFINTFSVS